MKQRAAAALLYLFAALALAGYFDALYGAAPFNANNREHLLADTNPAVGPTSFAELDPRP